MCGIFALLNNDEYFTRQFQEEQFKKGAGRGPEHSVLTSVNVQTIFGFHRLAINGLNPESNQPIRVKDVSLICNGEIYNYRDLYDAMDITPTTDSDCEVIIHLYLKYGIEHTLQMLDGVFSFVLMDARINLPKHKIYVARDPYGVRPLFWLRSPKSNHFTAFASELKCLSEFYQDLDKDDENEYMISAFEPGHLVEFDLPWMVSPRWTLSRVHKYHSTGFNTTAHESEEAVLENIRRYFTTAVFKRCCTTDRPIACLLSGGLDSSLVAALVSDYHRIHNLPLIETYSIGLEGSDDLKYARIVADHIGSVHNEIIVSETDFTDAVPTVIRAIESYDTTTVRASLGNWMIGKYISENSEAKVIFNGDGSDELCGGYLYMHKCPDSIEFDKESRRLLKDIHFFDVLRSDRCISSHGLEPRTPFLDRSWVQYYLSLSPEIRYHPNLGNKEKYLLRSAFSDAPDSRDLDLLPSNIIWRRKEAFSDGVSLGTRSLYQILQEKATSVVNNATVSEALSVATVSEALSVATVRINNALATAKVSGEKESVSQDIIYDHNPPVTEEQKWYRRIFENEYPGLARVIPYFWMPKYVEAKDASARTLSIY